MRVVVAGAGVIGFQVIRMLVANKHDVVAIDMDRAVCEAVYADTGAVILHGSATDIHILEKAGVRNSDVMACLVRNDSDNIACALLSKSLGVPSIIALLRKPEYEEAYRTVGVTQVISTTDILAHQLLVEIEQPKVRKIISIGGGKAEIYAVHIPTEGKTVGWTVKEITQEKQFPRDCVFMGIYHEGKDEFSIPRGDHSLNGQDTVFLVSNGQNIKKATDFLTKLK
jgi:trk system potassium uptake protein